MINLIRAFFIMLRAHKGQRDKAGKAYIYHPLTVARGLKGVRAKTLALIHDVVEDNENYSLEDFAFLDEEQTKALRLLTHKNGVSYLDYIARIKTNELARAVKLKDLEHNSELSRLKNPSGKDFERVEKNKKAICILQD